MIYLDTFTNQMRVVVIGAAGGLGSALADLLEHAPNTVRVYRLSRQAPDRHDFIDLNDEDSIVKAAQRVHADGPVDLVINATGLLHDADQDLMPEKTWRHLDADKMATYFHANCIAPSLAAKHFLPLLKKDSKSVMALLSARVGSIADNRVGGWHSYRAAKAGLNMMIRNFAIEAKLKSPQSIVIGLHPGTVDTNLSAPFRTMVKHDIFSAAQSAQYLLNVINGVAPSQSGLQLAWDGQEIPG